MNGEEKEVDGVLSTFRMGMEEETCLRKRGA